MTLFDESDLAFLVNLQVDRVITQVEDVLLKDETACTCRTCRRDIAACVLSRIPAAYYGAPWQPMVSPVPSDDELGRIIQEAIERVRQNPHHS